MIKFMKKIITLIVCITTLMVCCMISTSRSDVVASTDVEFINFDFSVNKTRERGKIKVKLIFSWDTTEEIIIEEITTKISGQIQSTYNKTIGTKNDDVYHYEIEYIVQNWQIGTLELDIKYRLFDQLGTDEISQKTFFIPGGKWISKEVNWGKALTVGALVTASIIILTYIIIENSKKGYMDSEQED